MRKILEECNATITTFTTVHTVAVLQGAENYELLRDGFAPVLKEMKELITSRFIEGNEQTIGLDFFLGGDYKIGTIQ